MYYTPLYFDSQAFFEGILYIFNMFLEIFPFFFQLEGMLSNCVPNAVATPIENGQGMW
jgi:hypothetical protein